MSLANKRIVDPVLTTLARGFSQPNLIGTKLFPVVSVEKEGGKIPQFGKEAFKVYNTERAIRSRSNRINPDGLSSIDFVLEEHDLEYPMDYREIDEDIRNLKLHATKVTTEGIALRLEKKIADLVQNLSNFPTGNKITLDSASKFTTPTSDPIAVFETAKEALRSKIAKRPNVCILGAASYAALKNHPVILDRIKFTQHAIIEVGTLETLLGFDKIYIGESVFVNDTTGSFSDVWADNAILAYVPMASADVPNSYYEPSFAYTLQKNAYPIVDVYEETGNKVQVVRTTNIFVPKIVGADAGYLINDTNA